ncbi:MAG: hypothetical protein EZS28_026678, partial [Streblomastix strix]
EDDYDYYESQAAKIRQNEITSKTVWQAAVSAINDSKTRKYGGSQLREEAGMSLLHLSVIQTETQRKLIDYRLPVQEQDLDDNEATPDNVVVFDKKKNAIYSVDGYSTAVGFGDPEHQYKKIWKKQNYIDVNDLKRAALAAKLKQQNIKNGPYMK